MRLRSGAKRGAYRADRVQRIARRAAIAASRTPSSTRRAADRASGVAPLQMALFVRIRRDSAEVWIGLDGSTMGGRTIGSSWTDHWPSRVITWRSFAHEKQSGYTAGGCNVHVMQPVDAKAEVTTCIKPEERCRWGGKAHVLCTASGIAFLQQIDGFIGICRDWAEVWIGLDGSAKGGRTMGSSWTDHELSRVITSRSSAHKSLTGEFWQSSGWGRLWNLHVKQRVEKKTDKWTHALIQKISPVQENDTCSGQPARAATGGRCMPFS